MALWIVRWPGVGASLVAAESEEELELVLDEVADIDGCTWEPYDGPLWIDFTLRTSYRVRSRAAGAPPEEQDVLIESVDEMRSSASPLKISLPIEDGSDTAAEFHVTAPPIPGWQASQTCASASGILDLAAFRAGTITARAATRARKSAASA